MNIKDELEKFCKKKGNTAFETYDKIMLFMKKHKSEWLSPYFVVHLTDIRPEILLKKLKNKIVDVNQIDKAMSYFLTRLSIFGLLERQVLGKDVTFRFTGVLSEKSCLICNKANNNKESDRCSECKNKISQLRKEWKIERKRTALLENKKLCSGCLKCIDANSKSSRCIRCYYGRTDQRGKKKN